MKSRFLIVIVILFFIFTACNNKKLTEVVEVPLPTAEQKLAIGNPNEVEAAEGTFKMIKLPYGYDALAPNIDARTMELHYSKHYLTYTNNLNKAIKGTEFENVSIETILSKSKKDSTGIRNHAGAYFNHGFFWEGLGTKSGGQPKDTLAAMIIKNFGSFESFKNQFKRVASKQIGSGFTWLMVDKWNVMHVMEMENNDNPLMTQIMYPGTPLLCIDTWEHAYYMNYQYKRKVYVDAVFDKINWSVIEKRYADYLTKPKSKSVAAPVTPLQTVKPVTETPQKTATETKVQ